MKVGTVTAELERRCNLALQHVREIEVRIEQHGAAIDPETVIEKEIDTRPYSKNGNSIKPGLQATSAVLALKPESARQLQSERHSPLTF